MVFGEPTAPNCVLTRASLFLFYNFPGSNGAKSHTVRTGLSATPRPATQPFRQLRGAAGAARRRAAARIVQRPDSLALAYRRPDRWVLVRSLDVEDLLQ